MSSFTRALIVSPLADGVTWVTLRDFSYYTELNLISETVKVPLGFTTDFTSVPRLLWAFFPRWGKYGNAAVIHDWLYWSQIYDRKQSDAILLEGMQVLGTSKVQRYTIYACVRAFGFISWKRNQYDEKYKFKRVLTLEEEELSSMQRTQRLGLVRRMWWGMTHS